MSIYTARNRNILGTYTTSNGVYGGVDDFTSVVVATGGVTYSTAGSYLWTCPAGVTSVSVLCVGGGGGGGSSSGTTVTTPTQGGTSTFISTSVCYAYGGGAGYSSYSDTTPTNGATSWYALSGGGSNGGNGAFMASFRAGGGGGAGLLYSGSASAGTTYDWAGQGGYGVNIYSAGTTNSGGSGNAGGEAIGGIGGNYGAGGGGGRDGVGGGGGAAAWTNNYSVTPGTSYSVTVGGRGLGANQGSTGRGGGNGGLGCVRIIWGRTFAAGQNISAVSETYI